MSINIEMPALSPTMTEGVLASWVVKEGDKVEAGDVLAEIETDKATVEFEALDDGIVGKILVEAGNGDEIKVGTPIAILLEEGESLSDISIPKEEIIVEEEPIITTGVTTPIPDSLAIKKEIVVEVPSLDGEEKETVRQALNDTLDELLENDEDVIILGEEVANYNGAYKITKGLLDKYGPDRVMDTPITEMGFAGMAVGAAMSGLRPICEFMSFNFSLQAIDQILNSAAKTPIMSAGQIEAPIIFRGPNGAARGVAAQHSQDFASIYANVPGLVVVAPWSAEDAKGLLRAVAKQNKPAIFLENEMIYGSKFTKSPTDKDFQIPLGKAKIEVVGTDVTLVAYSVMVGKAIEAAKELAKAGISAEVINLRSIAPLDKDTILKSVSKTGHLISIEEGWTFAGISASINQLAIDNIWHKLKSSPKVIGSKHTAVPYNKQLEEFVLPQVADIVVSAKRSIEQADKVVKVSPLALRMAKERCIELAEIVGTGPRGKITKHDVQSHGNSGSTSASSPTNSTDSNSSSSLTSANSSSTTATSSSLSETSASRSQNKAPAVQSTGNMHPDFSGVSHEVLKPSNIEKVVADVLTKSKRDIPHYYVTVEFQVEKLNALRKQLNERKGFDGKITINDIILKACASTIGQFPQINRAWTDSDEIVQYNEINIGVAIATDIGLFSPTVFNANAKGIDEISLDIKDLATKARNNKLSMDEMSNSTFTLSNLGMFGVKSFTSIIPPQNGAILSVGGAIDGKISLTLASDHRVINGGVAGQFISKLRDNLEDPILMIS